MKTPIKILTAAALAASVMVSQHSVANAGGIGGLTTCKVGCGGGGGIPPGPGGLAPPPADPGTPTPPSGGGGGGISTGQAIGIGVGAFILGTAIANSQARRAQTQSNANDRHIEWCLDRWKSYDIRTDTYQPLKGPRKYCVSPYS